MGVIYKRCEIIATLCVAIFIFNFSFVLMLSNDTAFRAYNEHKGMENSIIVEDITSEVLSGYEAELNYKYIKEEFKKFFNNEYKIPTYAVSKENVQKLNDIKKHYRVAKILAFLSFVGIVFCMVILARRRMFNAFSYGAMLAVLFAAAGFIRLFITKNTELKCIKQMIFEQDYSYFMDGDVVLRLIDGNFAILMLASYFVCLFILVVFFGLLKSIINFIGRPHRF